MSNFKRKLRRSIARADGLLPNAYLPTTIARRQRRLDKALKKATKIMESGEEALTAIQEAAAKLAAEEETTDGTDNQA